MEENVVLINAGITITYCKELHICEKYYVWNPSTCNCENGKYVGSIMDNSEIMCY